jgi:hypothetical protein
MTRPPRKPDRRLDATGSDRGRLGSMTVAMALFSGAIMISLAILVVGIYATASRPSTTPTPAAATFDPGAAPSVVSAPTIEPLPSGFGVPTISIPTAPVPPDPVPSMPVLPGLPSFPAAP